MLYLEIKHKDVVHYQGVVLKKHHWWLSQPGFRRASTPGRTASLLPFVAAQDNVSRHSGFLGASVALGACGSLGGGGALGGTVFLGTHGAVSRLEPDVLWHLDLISADNMQT